MSFAYPAVLALLVVPVLLLAWIWKRSAGRIAMPFDHGCHESRRVWAFLLGLAESLPALILATVIVLLAGPQQLSAPKTKRVLTNIEFCVDVSSSMITPLRETARLVRRFDESDRPLPRYSQGVMRSARPSSAINVLHWGPLDRRSLGDPLRAAIHEAGKCTPVEGGDDDRQGALPGLQGDPGRARGGRPDDHPGLRRRKLRFEWRE